MRFIKKVLCFLMLGTHIALGIDQKRYDTLLYNALFEKGLTPSMLLLGVIARIKQCLPQQTYGPYQAYLAPEQQVINNCQPNKNSNSFPFPTNKPPCCNQDTSQLPTPSYAQESLDRTLANARGAFTHPFFNQQQPYISPAKLAMQEMATMICQRYDLTFDQAYQALRYYCSQYFGVSSSELNELCACNDYEYVASTIVSDGHLSQEQSENVWNFYCKYQNFYRNKKINHGLTRINEKYERLAKQKQQEAEKKQEALLHQQFLQETYATFLDLPDDIRSSYHQARLQAYEKTVQQKYAPSKNYCDLDAQTIGFCMAHQIDYQVVQQHCATPLQHQLYQEVADCYKKNACLAQKPIYDKSALAQQSLAFVQLAIPAIELETMHFASVCSDVAHVLIDTAKTIVESVFEVGKELITNPPTPLDSLIVIAAGLGYALHFTTQGICCLLEVNKKPEDREHCRAMSQFIVTNWVGLCDWCVRSSAQEKIKIPIKIIADVFLRKKFSKLISQSSMTCKGLLDQIAETQFLKKFSDIYTEHKLAFNLRDVGLHNMKQTATSLVKTEERAIQSATATAGKTARNPIPTKIINRKPKEVDTRCLLEKNLETVEKAKEKTVHIRKLSDGRIRYYRKESLASTPGPTRGSAYVLEYDPIQGRIRGWYESYNHAGKVSRVHPKMIDGIEIESLHYPHTGKELMMLAQKTKGT